jgi:methyl-accepting chemotaxis protein
MQEARATGSLNDIAGITSRPTCSPSMPPSRRREPRGRRVFAVVRTSAQSAAPAPMSHPHLAGRHHDLLGTSGAVADATNIDMSLAEKSRTTLQDLGSELMALTGKAREHSDHITAITEQMHEMTEEGVMAMQFEDIVTQMMSRISQRTTNVGDYMHAFLALQHDNETDGLQRFRSRSQKLVELLVNSHVKGDAMKANSAGMRARNSSNGDIELF